MAAGIAAAAFVPIQALATSGTTGLPVLGGSLTVGSPGSGTLPAATLGGPAVSGAINSATWSDTTGSGLGWNGTLALATALVYQGPWTPVGAAPALTSTVSGAYNGTVGNALVTVTVTTGTLLLTTVSWSDREASGTPTNSSTPLGCTNGSPCTVASGVTITFDAATSYAAGAVYTVHVGAMGVNAMVLTKSAASGPTATGTTLSGTNLPTLVNDTSVVPGNNTPVKFVSALLNSGMGTFTIAPGVTVSGWDPNNTWAGASVTFSATAQYAMNVGP